MPKRNAFRLKKPTKKRVKAASKASKNRDNKISMGTGLVYRFPRRFCNMAQSSIAGGGATADGTYCEYTVDANGANYILICNHATESNYGTLNFCPQFSDFAGYTELTALFQEYRIIRVDIELIFYGTTSQQTGVAGSDTALVIVHSTPYTSKAPSFAAGTSDHTCIDPMRQFDGYSCSPALVTTGQSLKYSITKPTVTVGGNSIQEQSPWLPTGVPNIPHFGRVFAFEYWNSTAGSGDYILFKAHARAQVEVRHNC